MLIEVMKSKIHCARVTEANLNYMGSITIDEDLMAEGDCGSGRNFPEIFGNHYGNLIQSRFCGCGSW